MSRGHASSCIITNAVLSASTFVVINHKYIGVYLRIEPTWQFAYPGKSFMNNGNCIGPNIEPWGNP